MFEQPRKHARDHSISHVKSHGHCTYLAEIHLRNLLLLVTGPDGTIIFANHHCFVFLGFFARSLIGESIFGKIIPNCQDKFLECVNGTHPFSTITSNGQNLVIKGCKVNVSPILSYAINFICSQKLPSLYSDQNEEGGVKKRCRLSAQSSYLVDDDEENSDENNEVDFYTRNNHNHISSFFLKNEESISSVTDKIDDWHWCLKFVDEFRSSVPDCHSLEHHLFMNDISIEQILSHNCCYNTEFLQKIQQDLVSLKPIVQPPVSRVIPTLTQESIYSLSRIDPFNLNQFRLNSSMEDEFDSEFKSSYSITRPITTTAISPTNEVITFSKPNITVLHLLPRFASSTSISTSNLHSKNCRCSKVLPKKRNCTLLESEGVQLSLQSEIPISKNLELNSITNSNVSEHQISNTSNSHSESNLGEDWGWFIEV